MYILVYYCSGVYPAIHGLRVQVAGDQPCINNVWTPFPSHEKKKNELLTLRGIANVSNLFDWTMHQVKGEGPLSVGRGSSQYVIPLLGVDQ